MKILITGGSASGKSQYAERVAAALPGPRFYIATMRPWDKECEARIEKHRRQRAGLGFETVEHYGDLRSLRLPARGTALLECMSNLTANGLYAPSPPEHPLEAVRAGLRALADQCGHLIVVTNEVFSDGIAYDESLTDYLRLLAGLNEQIGRDFDHVIEVVCGIPIAHKGAVL